jgi:Uma2 family endonuclease
MGARAYAEHYTYDDYKNWEGEWEIIDGFPYAMSPKPMIRHQRVSGNIYAKFREKNSCKKCFPAIEIDYKISEDTVVSPDVVFACGDDLGDIYLKKAPKIVVEILSKSTARKDRDEKYSLYEREGIKYYLIVDANLKTAEIYKLDDKRYKLDKKLFDETYLFEIDGCDIEFEFKDIWVD